MKKTMIFSLLVTCFSFLLNAELLDSNVLKELNEKITSLADLQKLTGHVHNFELREMSYEARRLLDELVKVPKQFKEYVDAPGTPLFQAVDRNPGPVYEISKYSGVWPLLNFTTFTITCGNDGISRGKTTTQSMY